MVGRRRSWTDESLRDAVVSSRSTAQVLRRLGLRPAGGNYALVQRRIAKLTLSTAHWTRQGYLKGQRNLHAPKLPLDKILRKGSSYQSNKLRKRLLSEGVLAPICSDCGLAAWQGRPIPLELDHIDGDRTNNALANLRLVCPNCHALTSTYRGRNTRYDHIPGLSDMLDEIKRLGSPSAYARKRGVSVATVRGWLKSERLRRQAS